MSELTERLRVRAQHWMDVPEVSDILREAADRIEELERIRNSNMRSMDELDAARKDAERGHKEAQMTAWSQHERAVKAERCIGELERAVNWREDDRRYAVIRAEKAERDKADAYNKLNLALDTSAALERELAEAQDRWRDMWIKRDYYREQLAEARELLEDAWEQWAYDTNDGSGYKDKYPGGLTTLEGIEEFLTRAALPPEEGT